MNFSRRHFLRGSGALSVLGGTGLLNLMASQKAFAADTGGYKAIVCIFLFGGMDHFDTLLPVDQESYNDLVARRSDFLDTYQSEAGGSSRERDALIELQLDNAADFGGRRFGLPRQLQPVASMFNAGEAAIVSGIGPLIEPVTRSTVRSDRANLPDRLFSHNDQQSTWMALGVEGSRLGWGGQFADRALRSSTNANPAFASLSTAGNQVFLSGETARQYAVPSGGSSGISYLSSTNYIGSGSGGDQARSLLREHLRGLGVDQDNLFERDAADIVSRAVLIDEQFRSALDLRQQVTTPVPANNRLASQLRTIAETITVRQYLDAPRQVFFASMGGFDTHSGQANTLPRLHAQIAEALAFFNAALKEIGAFNDVVTFTASEFGRTLLINGDGSDHGWAGTQFVMGGPVVGRRLYGTFPSYDVDSEEYWNRGGRPIPTVSVDQFAATLGRWFGLSGSELSEIFPNLSNFNESNIGFV